MKRLLSCRLHIGSCQQPSANMMLTYCGFLRQAAYLGLVFLRSKILEFHYAEAKEQTQAIYNTRTLSGRASKVIGPPLAL